MDASSKDEASIISITVQLKHVTLALTRQGLKLGRHPVSYSLFLFLNTNEDSQKVVSKWDSRYPLDENKRVIMPSWPSHIIGKILSGLHIFVDIGCRDELRYTNEKQRVQQWCTEMGGIIEPIYSKKVNLVLFREGLKSTYVRARRDNKLILQSDWAYHTILRAHFQSPVEFQLLKEDRKGVDDSIDPNYFQLAEPLMTVRRREFISFLHSTYEDDKSIEALLKEIEEDPLVTESDESSIEEEFFAEYARYVYSDLSDSSSAYSSGAISCNDNDSPKNRRPKRILYSKDMGSSSPETSPEVKRPRFTRRKTTKCVQGKKLMACYEAPVKDTYSPDSTTSQDSTADESD